LTIEKVRASGVLFARPPRREGVVQPRRRPLAEAGGEDDDGGLLDILDSMVRSMDGSGDDLVFELFQFLKNREPVCRATE
jgi:hypothetical protein